MKCTWLDTLLKIHRIHEFDGHLPDYRLELNQLQTISKDQTDPEMPVDINIVLKLQREKNHRTHRQTKATRTPLMTIAQP
jgi:hypothetical protein